MEDATITQDKEVPKEQGLYQDGRYPSVIDTDHLVFQIGRLFVQNFNKEKLLDSLLQKDKMLESKIAGAYKIRDGAEKKIKQYKDSNDLYVENNKRLDAALVQVREECKKKIKEKNQEILKLKEINKVKVKKTKKK